MKKRKAWNKGKPHLRGVPKPWMKEVHKGERNVNWKGNDAGYRALHIWVQIALGKPEYCVKCGAHGIGHQMHWANISGRYLRDLTDWIRLCPKCHRAFDTSRPNQNSD